MDKKAAARFVARHPVLVTLIVAGLGAWGAYNAFEMGITYAHIRDAVAELDRAASEALGG